MTDRRDIDDRPLPIRIPMFVTARQIARALGVPLKQVQATYGFSQPDAFLAVDAYPEVLAAFTERATLQALRNIARAELRRREKGGTQ